MNTAGMSNINKKIEHGVSAVRKITHELGGFVNTSPGIEEVNQISKFASGNSNSSAT